MTKLSPSMLAADVMHLQEDIARIVNCGPDYLHLDIMDGHFVPNISYGPDLVKAINKNFTLPLDVHLMLSEPEKYIEAFVNAGSDIITIHAETENFANTLQAIKEKGVGVGASVKPGTAIESIYPFLEQLDLVLIMTVEPGFGGQSFMHHCVEKIEKLRAQGYKGIINVDGGVNMQTAPICIKAGADMLVMGTALFGAQNPQEVVDYIHSL